MQHRLSLVTLLAIPVALPLTVLAQQAPSRGPVPALYATKAEAEKAAKLFHCTGAHQMGDQWMPCAAPGEAHGGSH